MGYRNAAFFMLACIAGGSVTEGADRVEINFEYVVEEARSRAERDYRPPDASLPKALESLDYDQYRDIRFRPEEALWRSDGLPWGLEFFHRGYLYEKKVEIYEFTDTHVQPIRFVADWFDYGPRAGIEREWFPSKIDYAGLRLKYPQHDPKVFDEIAVFLGASYFRMLGKNQQFGISARGLAVDTLRDEEFPDFVKFWLKRPALEDESVLIYALLDGPSVTGAYEFRIHPGEILRAEVKCTVFLRSDVERLGFAPFSSMYFFGENTMQSPPDYRPEVHDSDGLLIALGEEQHLWRPLTNEHHTKDSTFAVDTFEGFGLLQRDRNFSHYEDLESAFEERPSVWVEPVGDWPAGKVRLIELLSRNEIMDNIVAFWEPETLPEVQKPFTLQYVLHWKLDHPTPLGVVVATRVGESINATDEGTVIIDFNGIPEDRLKEGAQPAAMVTVGEGGELAHLDLKRNPHIDGWRLALQLKRSEDATPGTQVPIKARLEVENEPVTETWTYPWILPE